MFHPFLNELFANGGIYSKHLNSANKVVHLTQLCPTRGPRAAQSKVLCVSFLMKKVDMYFKKRAYGSHT